MAFACSISLLVVLAAAISAAEASRIEPFISFGSDKPILQASRIEPFISLGSDKPILQDHLVAKVNGRSDAGWKADINSRFANATVKEFKKLLGTFLTSKNEGDFVRTHPQNLKLPKHFDAREAWPGCPSIGNILDQGHCGACWAFGAVEALSDRFCIVNKENVTLSVNDLLSCCGFECGYGCDGGYPIDAWRYFIRSGVVTKQCDPYFDEVGCKHPGCSPEYSTPPCMKECKDNEDWSNSKHYAESAYAISSDPYDIMAEVFTNGPVEVSFTVYADFAVYKSGVYKYIIGDYLGGHAVKIIGWGTTEEGLDYWIVANSWNRSWGEDGYFKIARGSNECGIEGNAVAGLPATKSLSGQMYLAQ